ALVAYDEVVSRFGEAEATELLEPVAMALFNKGVLFKAQERFDEALAACDEVVSRFGEAEATELLVQVAKALFNKGVLLEAQERFEDALAAYDAVVSRFGKAEATELLELVGRSAVQSVFSCVESKNFAAAVERADRFNENDRIFKNLPEKIRGLLLLAKAYALGKQNDQEAAKVVIDKVKEIVGDDEQSAQWAAAILGEAYGILDTIPRIITPEKQKSFKTQMQKQQGRSKEFLSAKSSFAENDRCIFFDLRQWNSFTPTVPDMHEIDLGGGYYIWFQGQGIVIDPGHDYISNFGKMGGRIHDIHHIVITHAHNDHTQDFESLLGLFFQYNRECLRQDKPVKKIHVYLSHGAERKFCGFLPLRDSSYIGQVEVLNPGDGCGEPRRIKLFGLPEAELVVLPAYHDDVITSDLAVGVAFNFQIGETTKRVVFTGDTGLFPPARKKNGEISRDKNGDPILQHGPEAEHAIYRRYPQEFQRPDMLVPHIGSIKTEYEFEDFDYEQLTAEDSKRRLLFYPNHLGIRGLLMMLEHMKPRVAIVSEIGEELKDFRYDLAEDVEKIMRERTWYEESPVDVYMGDLTVIYDIGKDMFFCHETTQFEKRKNVIVRPVTENEHAPYYCPNLTRGYFFLRTDGDPTDIEEKVDLFGARTKHHKIVEILFSKRP
ncbi:MAG: MBL fold metallo-hydrolase, partial [Candidatus Lernaella stagnicola]|nr:MBL fold metallo-hydrolase [Candidatus Lernaella stagnicola]